MSRYIFMKEGSHIMIAKADYYTTDPTNIIEFFVQDAALAEDGPVAGDILSEEIAKFGAVELLFPYELRAAAKARLLGGTDTLFKISEWLEAPEFVVEFALSDRYMEFAKRMWESV
jgi:hypothetical protein